MWNRRLQLPRMQKTNSRRLTIISHVRVTFRSLSTTDSPILIWGRSIPWESGWMHIIIGLSWYMDYFKEIFRKATSALQKKNTFQIYLRSDKRIGNHLSRKSNILKCYNPRHFLFPQATYDKRKSRRLRSSLIISGLGDWKMCYKW